MSELSILNGLRRCFGTGRFPFHLQFGAKRGLIREVDSAHRIPQIRNGPMIDSFRTPRYRVLFLLGFAVLLGISQYAEAQGTRQPLRSALPARPSFTLPQAPNAKPAASPRNNTAAPSNVPNSFNMDGNTGFRPDSRMNRNFNDFGYSPWGYNDWYGWNGYSNPYWNAVLNINAVNPAMNGYWTAPAWGAWNMNPYWFNSNLNPGWNGFNPTWTNYGPFWQPGLPVGNWNPMMPNWWGGANQNPER